MRICKNCKKQFKKPVYVSKRKWKKDWKFCSLKCRSEYGWIEKICPICQKDFKSWKYQKRIYCSITCKNRADRGGKIWLYCKKCKRKFFVKKARYEKQNPQFCSKKCYESFGHREIRGNNHWNWKGGVSKNHRRETKQYKEWRLNVYRRDYFKCQDCKKHCNQYNIVVHHLKSWNKYPKLRYEISNGITLCRSCHKVRHKK